jgi:hypothetical protein
VAVLAAVAGVPLVLAVVLGIVAGVVGAAAQRARGGSGRSRDRRERIDPFTVGEPWRRFVQNALQARNRFDSVVERVPAGPLHDSLQETATRMHAVAEESWAVAQRGQVLAQARRRIDVADIDRSLARLGEAEAEAAAPPGAGPDRPGDALDIDALDVTSSGGHTASMAEALRSQRASAERLDRVIDQAEGQLRLLGVRLDQAVTQVLELSSRAAVDTSTAGLELDVDEMATEMAALRQALDEAAGPTTGPLPAGGPG